MKFTSSEPLQTTGIQQFIIAGRIRQTRKKKIGLSHLSPMYLVVEIYKCAPLISDRIHVFKLHCKLLEFNCAIEQDEMRCGTHGKRELEEYNQFVHFVSYVSSCLKLQMRSAQS
jgi:hypothetical protein